MRFLTTTCWWAALSINNDRLEGCTTVQNEEDGDDSEWEDPNEDGSAFDIFEEI